MSGEAALGAAAAANPYGAILGAGVSALGGALSPAPAGPSNASSLGSIGGAAFDNSGWNVTFGNDSGITSDRTQSDTSQLSKYLPYVIAGAVFLIGWRALKK